MRTVGGRLPRPAMWRMTPRLGSPRPRPFPLSETGAHALAAVWGIDCALGVAALTWSGQFYLRFPLVMLAAALAGLVGEAAGWALASRLRRVPDPLRLVLLTNAPLLLLVWLVSLGLGPNGSFIPDYRADLDAYRGGCLAGTDYSGSAYRYVSVTSDEVAVYPRYGNALWFRRTGHSWPSRERAELGGEGVIPADDLTRFTLAAHGCP
ncbi:MULTISPECIES: hypothetical protein [unclassified Amycolatopsis]|uniref:hypothetical protein n=1 Tax=unclassified Amycolatopsis TaxID=2618356 RepID=UPI0028758EEF|nr:MULTISPECIES: hypothetical protein [unclassified Amycolatopsis]MDS0140572.1 hypothetical protein [Amycolatopsis sp. 505]MDS0149222.1 hypothetical protein [Amycolatopsis sp. CM201R]